MLVLLVVIPPATSHNAYHAHDHVKYHVILSPTVQLVVSCWTVDLLVHLVDVVVVHLVEVVVLLLLHLVEVGVVHLVVSDVSGWLVE